MKRFIKKALVTALCFSMVNVAAVTNTKEVNAAESNVIATVDGVVLAGTTCDMLQLKVNNQTYKIKIDSNTDTSECNIILPGNKLTVQIAYGNDSYLHAVKITSLVTANQASNNYQKTTVNGNVLDGTTSEVIKLSTIFGDQTIKIDQGCDFKDCKIFTIGKNVDLTIYKAADNTLHAIKVSDGNGTSQTSIVTNTSGTTYTASGTIQSGSNENIIYLNTSAGTMTIKLDANTSISTGRMIVPGAKLTVSYYRGSDAYLHAASLTAQLSSNAVVDASKTYTVTGTVGNKSTEALLVLKTSTGDMQIKLDATTSYSNGSVLVEGKTLTVTCARGSDAFLHATSITIK